MARHERLTDTQREAVNRQVELCGNVVTPRGSSVETPRRQDALTTSLVKILLKKMYNFSEFFLRFEEFYNAVITLWERNLGVQFF